MNDNKILYSYGFLQIIVAVKHQKAQGAGLLEPNNWRAKIAEYHQKSLFSNPS